MMMVMKTTSRSSQPITARKITPRQIFVQFEIHSVLQTHLLRVTSLMDFLVQHWQGPNLNRQLLLETMLLHDLGNLIKFDLRPNAFVKLMKSSELPRYRALQAQWQAQYGFDVDEVTSRLIRQLPLHHQAQIIDLIMNHAEGTTNAVVTSDNWTQKLCDYTDFRVGPHGLLTLAERFTDLTVRYRDRRDNWQDTDQIQRHLELFQTLESQLQTHLSCDLATLTGTQLEPIDRWLDFEFAILQP